VARILLSHGVDASGLIEDVSYSFNHFSMATIEYTRTHQNVFLKDSKKLTCLR